MSAVPQVRQVVPAQEGGKEDRKVEEEEGGKTEGSVATKVPLESRLPARGTQGQNESSNHTENAPSLQDTSPRQYESPAAVEVAKEAAEPRKGKKDHPRPTVSGPEHQQHGQKQKRPRQEGMRAHVFGDANAYAMKHAVLSMTNWDKCVQFHTRPQATLEQVCDAVEQTAEVWNKEESLVVIHAGLQDIAELGQTPEESARELKKRLSGWIEKAPHNRILIYALPETHSEEQLKTACGQWNSSVHQVCRELGLQV
ncbi:hypothetical protein HPB48_003980 [Haemaphysalis longicornis]|uniref:Uncharacterized protein n=1 Tax=Haemaphysalis longicornis TaxID=44386 RepID=A0A9J6GF14_HAELO|nr:hypothetical protein HPB48_003980 [Haemaphysalis longicornis]